MERRRHHLRQVSPGLVARTLAVMQVAARNGTCDLLQREIAARLGVSRPAVVFAIQELEAGRLIRSERQRDGHLRYTLVTLPTVASK